MELYHFSSRVPKVKKSIKKFKNTYNNEFLLKVLNNMNKESPQKFLQPFKIYRFYGDFTTIDNPSIFRESEGQIYQLDLHFFFKTISHIDIGDQITIKFNDKFGDQYCPVDLYIDRLNSLGDKMAHELAMFCQSIKPKLQIQNSFQAAASKEWQLNHFPILEDTEKESYQRFQELYKEKSFQLKNSFFMTMKKIFLKTPPFLQYGPILSEVSFNNNLCTLFMNKKMEDFSPEDARNLLKISSVPFDKYFFFFFGMMKHISDGESEFHGGLKTSENIFLSCVEKLNKFEFIGKHYEETIYIVSYSIDQFRLDNLNNHRIKIKQEEENKINLAKAKLKTKFKEIKHIYSDSWKALCVLYYGNNGKSQKEIENSEEDIKNKYWNSVDMSKVCKYRMISKKTP